MRALPSFWIKAALALGLVALADGLIFQAPDVGLNMGLTLLALAVAAGLAHPALRRSRLGLAALGVAAVFAVVQIEHVSFLAWVLFWISLGVAVLAPRAARDGAWQWTQRLVMLGLKGLIVPLGDMMRLANVRARAGGTFKAQMVALTLVLPVIGGVVFFWLFAAANPIIGDWLASLSIAAPDLPRIAFGGLMGLLAWGALRPHGLRKPWKTPDAVGEIDLPGVTTASITLSLVVFNALFALQNGLDIAFLWSGAALPQGMSFAEYAHRGAYPLIATALLAGLFVVAFLRPGTATANSPLVRRLVILWIVQNVFLVASTALRTLDYVDVYSLTVLRIAALLWMALVATGLALIGWRLIRAKSTAWLINANVLAVGVVLAICAVVDLGSVAARWNVLHAREVGGRGAPLDVCYLLTLDDAALVPMARLEQQPLSAELAARVAVVRDATMRDLAQRQADWRSWTWRGARRLASASALVTAPSQPLVGKCDWTPLTPAPNPGT